MISPFHETKVVPGVVLAHRELLFVYFHGYSMYLDFYRARMEKNNPHPYWVGIFVLVVLVVSSPISVIEIPVITSVYRRHDGSDRIVVVQIAIQQMIVSTEDQILCRL